MTTDGYSCDTFIHLWFLFMANEMTLKEIEKKKKKTTYACDTLCTCIHVLPIRYNRFLYRIRQTEIVPLCPRGALNCFYAKWKNWFIYCCLLHRSIVLWKSLIKYRKRKYVIIINWNWNETRIDQLLLLLLLLVVEAMRRCPPTPFRLQCRSINHSQKTFSVVKTKTKKCVNFMRLLRCVCVCV